MVDIHWESRETLKNSGSQETSKGGLKVLRSVVVALIVRSKNGLHSMLCNGLSSEQGGTVVGLGVVPFQFPRAIACMVQFDLH